jgi:hypothetical protein
LDAAVKPLTPSNDLYHSVIALALSFRVIFGHKGELFASAQLGKGTSGSFVAPRGGINPL